MKPVTKAGLALAMLGVCGSMNSYLYNSQPVEPLILQAVIGALPVVLAFLMGIVYNSASVEGEWK